MKVTIWDATSADLEQVHEVEHWDRATALVAAAEWIEENGWVAGPDGLLGQCECGECADGEHDELKIAVMRADYPHEYLIIDTRDSSVVGPFLETDLERVKAIIEELDCEVLATAEMDDRSRVIKVGARVSD